MSDHLRMTALGALAIAVLIAVSMAVPGPAGAGLRSTTTDPAVPETSEPPTSQPNTSQAPTSAPETSQAPTSAPETPSDAGDDENDDTAAVVIGVVGFLALIGIAAWWMVRLRNEDDEPHPRQPITDDPLPGQDLV